MADDDHSARPGADRVVQAVPRVQVEVVGRLVKQQHAGATQELRGQAQQHRLAAGQLADPPVQRDLLKPEPVQRGPGPFLGVPVRADAGEVLLAGVPGLDRGHGRPDVGDAERVLDPAAGERHVLRHVAQLAGDLDRAARGGELTGDQAQQGRLAGSVQPDQAGPARADDQRQIGEDRCSVRPGETQAGEDDGGLWCRHGRLP